MRPIYLMSFPRRDWSIRGGANFLSSKGGEPPSARGALRDWMAVADAIEGAGGLVLVMPPSPARGLTGLPYTAEAGEFYRGADGRPRFLLPRMKPAHRQGEPEYTAGFVAGLGWEAEQVSAVWEAQGDSLRVGRGKVLHTFGEGPMARTEEAARAEVAQKLGGEALGVRFVADPWFHGNTFMGYYESPDAQRGVLLLCASALPLGELERVEAFVRHAELVPITPSDSLGYATNALQVGGTVIAPSGLGGHILEVWRGLGLEVVELDLSQLFRKGGGAAVCLSCRLYGLDEAEVPTWARYGETWRARLQELLPTYEGE